MLGWRSGGSGRPERCWAGLRHALAGARAAQADRGDGLVVRLPQGTAAACRPSTRPRWRSGGSGRPERCWAGLRHGLAGARAAQADRGDGLVVRLPQGTAAACRPSTRPRWRSGGSGRPERCWAGLRHALAGARAAQADRGDAGLAFDTPSLTLGRLRPTGEMGLDTPSLALGRLRPTGEMLGWPSTRPRWRSGGSGRPGRWARRSFAARYGRGVSAFDTPSLALGRLRPTGEMLGWPSTRPRWRSGGSGRPGRCWAGLRHGLAGARAAQADRGDAGLAFDTPSLALGRLRPTGEMGSPFVRFARAPTAVGGGITARRRRRS